MLFNSLQFLIFLPIVISVYFLIPQKAKNIWLLLSSYYFYMCWNAKYGLLILFSTVVTYFCGIILEKIKHSDMEPKKSKHLKRLTLTVSLVINLGILFFFKYLNFSFDLLEKAFAYIHIQLNMPTFDVLLPVGISFYTFQALGYTIDVYRDDIYAEKNFISYALFVSFFPQLVAGPIERSKNLLKQLSVTHKFNFEKARDGLLLMLWGFFLKIVLADRISIFVDTVYGNIEDLGGMYLIVATLLFAVQIYCDFSGYSTIAMGAAELLGIRLMDNFNAPYLCTSVGTFWRNWHISLTSWFKDYLYIPLGGSRKGKFRKHLNKMIVFLASGLWHGAKISFIVWGGLNGLYQVIGEMLAPVRDWFVRTFKLNRESFGHRLLQIVGTFLLIDFSWIFFRADSFHQAIQIIHSMFTLHNPWILFDGSLYTCGLDSKNFCLMLICIGILLFSDICKKKNIIIRDVIVKQDYWFRWIFIAVVIVAIMLFGKWGPTFDQANFIYFQF